MPTSRRCCGTTGPSTRRQAARARSAGAPSSLRRSRPRSDADRRGITKARCPIERSRCSSRGNCPRPRWSPSGGGGQDASPHREAPSATRRRSSTRLSARSTRRETRCSARRSAGRDAARARMALKRPTRNGVTQGAARRYAEGIDGASRNERRRRMVTPLHTRNRLFARASHIQAELGKQRAWLVQLDGRWRRHESWRWQTRSRSRWRCSSASGSTPPAPMSAMNSRAWRCVLVPLGERNCAGAARKPASVATSTVDAGLWPTPSRARREHRRAVSCASRRASSRRWRSAPTRT